jgi:hypothetical protein
MMDLFKAPILTPRGFKHISSAAGGHVTGQR